MAFSPELHLDSWHISPRPRTKEASGHIEIMHAALGMADFSPQGILELGSGRGGVTDSLRTLFKNTPVLALDCDQQSEGAAQRSQVDFELTDILQLQQKDLHRLTESRDYISALRTSGEIVLHMLDLLHKVGFKGVFVCSLIKQTDGTPNRNFISQVREKAHALGIPLQEQTLIEMRGLKELGFGFDFSRVPAQSSS